MEKIKKQSTVKEKANKVLTFLNRYSHFIDILLYFLLADYLIKIWDNSFEFLVYILPIFQIYRVIKYEFLVAKSKDIIKTTARNKRVQGFSGSQGAGKTSFMLYSAYVIKPSEVYTNFPAKIRNKFTYLLDKSVLNMEEQIPDYSLLCIDEATMLFHNLTLNIKNKYEVKEIYPQQLQQQIVRHCYDGQMFYSSVDLTRLPQMLKDNIGLTNYMLGQGSITLSFVTSKLLSLIGSFFDVKIYNTIRYWDVQQLERIPEKGYSFDLSTQEKDTNLNNYANLIRFYSFSANNRFDYDDRFLRGIYEKLPKHIAKAWETLKFDENLLREIGYGDILDFFNARIK